MATSSLLNRVILTSRLVVKDIDDDEDDNDDENLPEDIPNLNKLEREL